MQLNPYRTLAECLSSVGRAFVALALFAAPAMAELPVVLKVEPPSWWIGHSWNPVRVLIEGRNLSGASLSAVPGILPGHVAVSGNGNWAFVDLAIAPDARPGARAISLKTASGAAAVSFELLPPGSRRGQFQGFGPDDVIYLAMPDRFANSDQANDDPVVSPGLLDRSKPRHYHGGDLAGVRKRLPYLESLGITALWLTPWYDNVNHLNFLEKYTAANQRSPDGVPSTDYHGYGAVDFYGIEEHFGDMKSLRDLVAAAHKRGFKVVQDQVANHTGPYHRWTTNSPMPDWFNGTVEKHLENTWQTWTIADPNPPIDKLKATLDGWFINILPDLNQDNSETSTYLIQNSLWWVGQTGLDAVRQDTLPYVPRTHWARWTTALKREHPRLTILGEMLDGNPKLVSFFQGGRKAFDGIDTGVDTLFDFPLCYAIRDVFAKHQSMTRLSETLAADTNYVDPDVLVTLLGLHDMGRFLSEPGADVTGLKLAFTFLLSTRGTPLIYYGDEIAMRGGGDPDNRRDFPGGFPGDVQNAFTAKGRNSEQAAVFEHLRKLVKLRRELEPMRRGDYSVAHVSRDGWASVRRSGGRVAVVVINNGAEPMALALPITSIAPGSAITLRERFPAAGRLKASGGYYQINLPPRSSAIYSN